MQILSYHDDPNVPCICFLGDVSPWSDIHHWTPLTCAQGTPVVPGRDRDIRCSPLQPEQDSTVRIHILQLYLRITLSQIHPQMMNPIKITCKEWKEQSAGGLGEPDAARCLHPPPRPSHKLSSRNDRGLSTQLSVSAAGVHGANPDAQSSARAAAITSTAPIQNGLMC